MHLKFKTSPPVVTKSVSSKLNYFYTLRLDKSNLDNYYMTTYEEIKNIPVPVHLLNDDTGNSANVTNDINEYYRMLIKALQMAENVNIFYK